MAQRVIADDDKGIRIGRREEFQKIGAGKTRAIASFDLNNGRVIEMTLNQGFANWLVGDTRELVRDIDARRRLLGVEDSVEKGYMGEHKYLYFKEGIEVHEGIVGGAVVVFQYPPKRR